MPFERKAWGGQVIQLTRAPMNLEDARAQSTPEVMVMRLSGHFIARGLARQLHGSEPLCLDQRGNRAVHGRDAQPAHMIAARFEHFGRTKGTTRVLKNLLDCIALTRSTFHYQ